MENLSIQEKSILYSESIRANVNSLRDLFDYINQKATKDQYNENYVENLNTLNSKIEKDEIITASKVTEKEYAFLPTNKSTDQLVNQAKLVK